MSGMSTLSMIGTTIQTTSGQIDGTTLIESSTTTINNENTTITTTLVVAMPATQPSDDRTAMMIGGIVGGVVALLLIVGVIAFIVMRNRKTKATQQSGNDGHSLQTRPPSLPGAHVQPGNNNYDRINIPTPAPPNYSERANIQQSPTRNHYDVLNPSEI